MHSRLNSVVDPILARAIDVFGTLDSGTEHPAPARLREIFIEDFAKADAVMGNDRGWLLASYAVAAWIDEMLVNHPWQGATWWGNNVLEVQLFNSRTCSTQFYAMAREAASLPDRKVLEIFYLCVMLGFRGIYGQPEQAATLASSLGLPPTLREWATHTQRMLDSGLQSPPLAAPLRPITGAPPYRGKRQLAWLCVTAALLVALNVIAFQL